MFLINANIIIFAVFLNIKFVENSNAQKIIKALLEQINTDGIVVNNIVPELQKLREFALNEEKPYLVKALRLASEHLQANNDFLIDIPSDEPIDDEIETQPDSNAIESLNYFISLMLDLENKHNVADIKEYNIKFQEF